jgi:hypothetical protein
MCSSDRSSHACRAHSCCRLLTSRAACYPTTDWHALLRRCPHESTSFYPLNVHARFHVSRLTTSGAPGSPAARRGRARGRRGRRGRRAGPERLVGRQEGLDGVRDGRRHEAMPHLRGPRVQPSRSQGPAHHRRLLGVRTDSPGTPAVQVPGSPEGMRRGSDRSRRNALLLRHSRSVVRCAARRTREGAPTAGSGACGFLAERTRPRDNGPALLRTDVHRPRQPLCQAAL